MDPATGVIYINANDIAWTGALAPNTGEHSPQGIYMSQCSICHGENMAGSPPALPSLIGVGARLTGAQIAATIKNGKGRMPGFPNLSEDEASGLIGYLTSGENKEMASSDQTLLAMKYRFTGYRKFLDAEGYPAIATAWRFARERRIDGLPWLEALNAIVWGGADVRKTLGELRLSV